MGFPQRNLKTLGMLIQKVSSQIPHQRVGGESFPDPFFLSSVPSPPCGNGKKTKGFALYILVYTDTCIEEKHPPAPWGHTGHSPRRKMTPVCPVLCHHRWLQSSPSPPVCFSLFFLKKKLPLFYFFFIPRRGQLLHQRSAHESSRHPQGPGLPQQGPVPGWGKDALPGLGSAGNPWTGIFHP